MRVMVDIPLFTVLTQNVSFFFSYRTTYTENRAPSVSIFITPASASRMRHSFPRYGVGTAPPSSNRLALTTGELEVANLLLGKAVF